LETSLKDLTIREALPSDTAVILSFIKGLAKYEEMSDDVTADEKKLFDSLFVKKEAFVLIALEHDKPIGFALYFKNYSTFLGQANMFLEDLFILESYRKKGYGKAMFHALATIAKKEGFKRIDWYCLDWNTPSIDFYHALGATMKREWVVFRLEQAAIDKLVNNQ
jgi:GNAT superfamily N-acetyltransferase